eukprot:2814856-Ditylum_brightwellii.AAC.1
MGYHISDILERIQQKQKEKLKDEGKNESKQSKAWEQCDTKCRKKTLRLCPDTLLHTTPVPIQPVNNTSRITEQSAASHAQTLALAAKTTMERFQTVVVKFY